MVQESREKGRDPILLKINSAKSRKKHIYDIHLSQGKNFQDHWEYVKMGKTKREASVKTIRGALRNYTKHANRDKNFG